MTENLWLEDPSTGRIQAANFFEIPVSWMDIHYLYSVQTTTIILACLTQVAHLSLHCYDSSTLAVSTIQLQPQPVGHTVSVSNHDIMCSECPP
jgi:hypothetical protein